MEQRQLAASVKTTTYTKTNPETIQEMFGTIAPQYDRTNALMSFQLHRYWNAQLIKAIGNPTTLLDLCAGTGEIAFGFLSKATLPKTAYLLDFCPEMLTEAKLKEKKSPHTLHYIQADAQEIPLSDQSVDAITIAYGIRNVKEPIRCFREARRVLKPGSRFAILELTRPSNPVLRLGHTLYLHTLLPILGKLSTSNQQAYEYLCSSIHTFVDPSVLKSQLQDSGFKEVAITPLMGGIATVIVANT